MPPLEQGEGSLVLRGLINEDIRLWDPEEVEFFGLLDQLKMLTRTGEDLSDADARVKEILIAAILALPGGK